MLFGEQKFVYKAFGLKITSEIFLPELLSTNYEKEKLIDVFVKKSDLNQHWTEYSISNSNFVINSNFIMFQVPKKATILIKNGNEILVSPFANTHDDYLRLYILGSCMGAILMQRKILPLHGSAIEIDGKAYAIVGDSGAGKSTLAKAFLTKGYKLLSDDVIPITFNDKNEPLATPAYPQQKLWLESLNEYGMNSEQFTPIFERETKFTVPVREQFSERSLPLAGIFELNKTDENQISIREVPKMERFHLLYYHTYRNFFLSGLGLVEWHFQTSAKMVNKIPFYELNRPISSFTANELAELIISTIKKEVTV